MAPRCGAKHICKAKCTKHRMLGPIFEVPMFKNGTPLWREANYFNSKCAKTPQSRTNFGSFDPQKLHAAVARSTFVSQNVENTTLSGHFLKFRCSKMARHCGAKYICKSKCEKTDGYGSLLKIRCQKIARRCGAKHICKSKCTKHLRFATFGEVSN